VNLLVDTAIGVHVLLAKGRIPDRIVVVIRVLDLIEGLREGLRVLLPQPLEPLLCSSLAQQHATVHMTYWVQPSGRDEHWRQTDMERQELDIGMRGVRGADKA
jgi:hypothetical protein